MKLKLEIPRLVYEEIMFYVNSSSDEISGLGTCSFNKELGLFQVGKIILLEQENSAATTDLDPKSIAKAMYEMRDEEHPLKFWWHSHVKMNVFWSGTDKTTMAELAEHGWFLSTVFNQRNEMKTCVTFPSDFGLFEFDDIETEIVSPISLEEKARWKANLKDKVKEKAKSVWGNPNHYKGSKRYEDDQEGYFDNNGRWNRYKVVPPTEPVQEPLLKSEADVEKSLDTDQAYRRYCFLERKLQQNGRLSRNETQEMDELELAMGGIQHELN